MLPKTHQTRGNVVRRAPGDTSVMIRQIVPQHPTTAIEQFLLMAVCIILPLEGNLPTVGGRSFPFIVFVVLTAYVVLCQTVILIKTLRHPVFLAGCTLVGVGLIMEFLHGSTAYFHVSGLFGIFLTLVRTAIIASLCRDQRALRCGLYGLLLAGVWLSIILFLTTYTSISSANVGGFIEAQRLRVRTLHDTPVYINWNAVAFFAALAAGVALALALSTRTRFQHAMFLAMSGICVIATFLTMSRSALISMALTFAAILYTYGIRRARVVRVAAILAIAILLWVPEAVYHRFTITPERAPSGQDVSGRTQVYSAVMKHLPEHLLTGMGVSQFWGDWGRYSGFNITWSSRSVFGGMGVFGAHNMYAQVTLYWGLLGLLAFFGLVWQVYRCLPRRNRADSLKLCLLGIAVAMLVRSNFTHNFERKEFAIALGLLAGASHWIWSREGMVQLIYHPARRALRKLPIAAEDQGSARRGL